MDFSSHELIDLQTLILVVAHEKTFCQWLLFTSYIDDCVGSLRPAAAIAILVSHF
jgi:hypothetical protein